MLRIPNFSSLLKIKGLMGKPSSSIQMNLTKLTAIKKDKCSLLDNSTWLKWVRLMMDITIPKCLNRKSSKERRSYKTSSCNLRIWNKLGQKLIRMEE